VECQILCSFIISFRVIEKKSGEMDRIRVQCRNLDYETFFFNKLHFGAKVKDTVVVFVSVEISN